MPRIFLPLIILFGLIIRLEIYVYKNYGKNPAVFEIGMWTGFLFILLLVIIILWWPARWSAKFIKHLRAKLRERRVRQSYAYTNSRGESDFDFEEIFRNERERAEAEFRRNREDFWRWARETGFFEDDESRDDDEYEEESEDQVYEQATPWNTVLEVSPDADFQTVRSSYRRLTKKYHPDIVATKSKKIRVASESKMKEINAAYDLYKRLKC